MSSISPGSPTHNGSMRSASADSPYSGGSGGGPTFRDGSTRMSPGRSPRAWARTNRSNRADFDAAAVRCCVLPCRPVTIDFTAGTVKGLA